MEGFLFYWLGWTAWIVCTFLISKETPYRTPISAVLLLWIAFSQHTVSITPTWTVAVWTVIIWILCIWWVAKGNIKQTLFMVWGSLSLTLGYAAFKLISLYDPVWVFIDERWLLAICLVACSVLLSNNGATRAIFISLGMVQGDWLFGWILEKWRFGYTSGGTFLLDTLMLGVIGIVFITTYEVTMKRWQLVTTSVKKERQRTS